MREREPIGCVYIYKEMCYKGIGSCDYGSWQVKICSVDPQIGDLRDEGAGEIWRHSAGEFLPEQGGHSSCSIWAFND